MVTADLYRLPPDVRHQLFLIYCGSELVGHVFAPQLDDCLVVRDLGLRAQPGLAECVVERLQATAERNHCREMHCVVFLPIWPAFLRQGFVEQKRRSTMQLNLEQNAPPPVQGDTSPIMPSHAAAVGELLFAAYQGTADDDGEGLEQWTDHARDVITGQYGHFLSGASSATPVSPPFDSVSLFIDYAPGYALLAHVATRRSLMNRGLARRLITCSLGALAEMSYRACFLEVTLSNANALHLYRSVGFKEIGPQIVYGDKRFGH
ncbi:MAG: GNAT family N-acetyltransferase [Chloroflexi bacterium]|nr:GNAT family N-acetyltransferase [Chloroflexota bacterium]MBI3732405.1 GNAT family N-acetyltransferase [Chloroflexota bacterium]